MKSRVDADIHTVRPRRSTQDVIRYFRVVTATYRMSQQQLIIVFFADQIIDSLLLAGKLFTLLTLQKEDLFKNL